MDPNDIESDNPLDRLVERLSVALDERITRKAVLVRLGTGLLGILGLGAALAARRRWLTHRRAATGNTAAFTVIFAVPAQGERTLAVQRVARHKHRGRIAANFPERRAGITRPIRTVVVRIAARLARLFAITQAKEVGVRAAATGAR